MEREQTVQIICCHSTFMNPQQPQPVGTSLVQTKWNFLMSVQVMLV